MCKESGFLRGHPGQRTDHNQLFINAPYLKADLSDGTLGLVGSRALGCSLDSASGIGICGENQETGDVTRVMTGSIHYGAIIPLGLDAGMKRIAGPEVGTISGGKPRMGNPHEPMTFPPPRT